MSTVSSWCLAVSRLSAGLILGLLVLVVGARASSAQTPASAPQVPMLVLPPITVVAQKEPAPVERVPASVTAISGERLRQAGLITISDAAIFAPNTFFSDLSARKISNARFRGIGSSPSNPGITTFIDGVPQLSTNTANVDLLDVGQVEFVRGAQSALFGRNTLGGVVNVSSRRPSLSRWEGHARLPIGSRGERGVSLAAGGPVVADRLAGAVALSVSRRDGYTRNVATDNLVDDRASVSAKGQLFFASTGPWSARVIVAGQRDRDGDYTLNDLGAVRQKPFSVSRNFEGRTDRDLVSTTFLAERQGRSVSMSTTTGLVDWRTYDETDLDYTPAPIVTRRNREQAVQFTQEVRLASASPVRLSEHATLAWQGGAFVFTQQYDQDAVNTLAPFVLSPFVPFAVSSRSPSARLEDAGLGLFGHATSTFADRVDLSIGVRVDHERRDASLRTDFDPPVAPSTVVEATRTFTAASPSVSLAFRPSASRLIYGSVARGFKAGGFNAASPAGSEAFGEEFAWHIEGGVKASALGGRVSMSAAAFSIEWTGLQLNLPSPTVPGQFYIANVGGASSRGGELDIQARAHRSVTVQGSLGVTNARFSAGSVSSGADVSGNRLPSTPRFTATGAVEVSHGVRQGLSILARTEVVGYGAFHYDDMNLARQDAYALANARAGVTMGRLTLHAWIRNALDTRYVPVAFLFDPAVAPSGFLGEPGKPRTFGIEVGVGF